MLAMASTAAVLAVASSGPPVSARAAAAPSGLVLQYLFDNDSGSTARDTSPSTLNGAYIQTSAAAARSSSVAGRGRAITLVGASHQYVAVPEADALDVDRFTVSALVRYTGIVNDQTNDRWEVLEKANAYWINIRTDGHVRLGGFFGGCTAAAWKYFDSTTTVPVDTWTHVAGTYNGNTLTIWINGRRAGSRAVSGRTCANNEPLAIGAKNAPSKGLLEAFWDGRLDEVRVYKRALTAAEIVSLVPAGLRTG
jgi:hypothetical protein